MGLAFRDFAPEKLTGAGFFSSADYASFEASVAAASAWITEAGVDVISVETVVLPNIWSRREDGTADPDLRTSTQAPTSWHQFVRVWYRKAGE
ncbi:hypothetical protein OAX78_03060 [Planctomycetota bacterium]|nr:hypothetical protein [Planctomycetota bacterium]